LEIIPVLDLRAGYSCRIIDTKNDLSPHVYCKNPLEQASIFKDLGVKTLHIVDIDGVFSGHPCNLGIAKKIIDKTGLDVQISGGYRNMESIIQAIEAKVKRVVLTTAAVRTPDLVCQAATKFADKIAVGIDSKNGTVAIEGWEYTVDKNVFDLASEIKNLGVNLLLYNDVKRTGHLCGPDYDTIAKLKNQYGMSVIASGGVFSLDCLASLKELDIEGVIVGKAIYTGAFDLRQAIEFLK
jgi:phosphoribosylformimino-5-aminoimidazole carboxamide ribotide isomerase